MDERQPAAPIKDGRYLGPQAVALIRQLDKAGKTQREISHIVGCSQPTVHKWLSELQDPIDHAKHLTKQAAPDFAKRVIKGKSEQVALEMLDRLGVTEKPGQGVKGQITVLIGGSDADVQVGIQLETS